MSYLDKVSAEISGNTGAQEQPVETTVENKVETPVETPKETKVETSKEEPSVETKVDKPVENQVETPKEDKQEPPKEKPDLSQLSKEEKAEHAFKRQLAKQKDKYESQIKQMHESFQKQLDDFKAEFKKSQPKEAPKQRSDFETDDEYIKYLVKTQNDADRAELEEKNAKERAEQEAKDKEAREEEEQRKQLADTFQRNCRASFQDEKAYGEFAQKVNKGIANGLGELLDQAPAIRDYLFYNQNGPMVLNEMLSSKDSFVRVMQNAGNPMEAVIEMHELARELKTKAATPVETQPVETNKPAMPKLGKPGAKSGGARTSIFTSDKDLIKFIRSR